MILQMSINNNATKQLFYVYNIYNYNDYHLL